MIYKCNRCTVEEDTIEMFLHHMKKNHLNFNSSQLFDCILCSSKINSQSYLQHYKRNHKTHFATITVAGITSTANTVALPSTSEIDPMDAAISRIFDKSRIQWSEMLLKMELNRKSVNDIHNQVMETIYNTFDLLEDFMDKSTAEKVGYKLRQKIRERSSYYRRKKLLDNSPYYIPAKKFIASYRQEQNPARDTVLWRANNSAEISIKDNLRRLFSVKPFADALIFPSDFANTDFYGHPFTGERTTELYEKLGTDFIALSIYCDEFGTVNPLGQAAATNKMMGCYFRVNNFPIELQDTNLIFIGFLALAIDVQRDDFQELLRNLLIPQLAALENGIDVPYKGQTVQMPVVVLNLLGDNLGVHQMSAYTTHFHGDVSCRMCYGTAADLKEKSVLREFRLKTAENYDQITGRNDCVGLEKHGIKNYCTFNRLQHFHVVEASCVDIMHDLFEGHLKKLLVYVVKSIIEDASNESKITLEDINNAVTSFPYTGRLAKNKPQKFFADHVKKGEISMSSAKTIMNTTLYLPLILNQGKIAINPDNKWYRLFLGFLDILDLLLAPKILKEQLPGLQSSIQTYLMKYINLGGHMTVKPHLTLHYPDTIKRFGVLTTCWSMPFETKHKAFKAYERNNNNHKDLAMTLTQRLQEQNVPLYEEMAKEDYLIKRREKKINDYFKVGEVCAYDVYLVEQRSDSTAPRKRLPKLGVVADIYVAQQRIKLKLLKNIKYSCTVHAIEVASTEELFECDISSLKVHKSFPKYGKFVRLPYAV